MNSVCLIGRLTRDPALRTTPGGTSICTVRLAFAQRGADDVGYIDVDVFGRQAEAVAEHKRKGDQVAVHGELRWREWRTAKQMRQAYSVAAQRVVFLGRVERDETEFEDAEAGPLPVPVPADEDIPF